MKKTDTSKLTQTETEQSMYLIDLQFWSEVGVDLFQQVYGSAGDVIASLNYHLGEKRIRGSPSYSRAESLDFHSYVSVEVRSTKAKRSLISDHSNTRGGKAPRTTRLLFFLLQYSGKQNDNTQQNWLWGMRGSQKHVHGASHTGVHCQLLFC